VEGKELKRRLVSGIASWSAAALLMAGCNMGGGGDAEPKLKALGKDEKATIKVMSTWDERIFNQQYGLLFYAKHPNIEIQVASTQGAITYGPDTDVNAEFEKFIEEHNPDVLMLTPDLYERMVEKGKLYELESVIKQDKFDLAGIMPGVLDTIKTYSGGKLYGLAPNFNSQALFYNKTLFERHGVPLPKDEMSWEELLELARRFPTTGDDSSRVYGFSLGNLDSVFRFAMMIGSTKGLSFADPDTLTMTMNTDGWKKAAQLALDSYKSNAIYRPNPNQQFRGGSMEEYYKQEPFIGGKVAMMLSGTYYMESLKQAKTALKDDAPQWDLVTIPVDPNNPEGSPSSFNIGQIFAINSQSPNLRAAWEFVKYINDAEYARVMSKSSSMTGSVTTRSEYFQDPEGRNVEAFYKIKGNSAAYNRSMAKLPQTFMGQLYPHAELEFKEVMEGKKSVDDAIQAIQERGQTELTKAKQAKDLPK
jgi:multiple sugar transport system substrate-binding protein